MSIRGLIAGAALFALAPPLLVDDLVLAEDRGPVLRSAGSESWTIVIRPASPEPVAYAPRAGRTVAIREDIAGSPGEPRPQIDETSSEGAQPATNAAVSGERTAATGRDTPATAASGAPLLFTYQQAYQSIPFSRAEYEANPSYRHDAAMELVFGLMRPTTIVRQTVPYFSRYPDMFRYRFPVFPYPNSGGGTLNTGVFFSPITQY